MSRPAGVIAPGLFLKGELRGEDDLIIEGRVEGQISLQKHLTVEPTGVVIANVKTENITIKGELHGDMQAVEKVEIHNGAKVIGNIVAPRIVIADGARFKGHVEMIG
jgi:cytoskeletal protein CcmA (bactofilin family)